MKIVAMWDTIEQAQALRKRLEEEGIKTWELTAVQDGHWENALQVMIDYEEELKSDDHLFIQNWMAFEYQRRRKNAVLRRHVENTELHDGKGGK